MMSAEMTGSEPMQAVEMRRIHAEFNVLCSTLPVIQMETALLVYSVLSALRRNPSISRLGGIPKKTGKIRG